MVVKYSRELSEFCFFREDGTYVKNIDIMFKFEFNMSEFFSCMSTLCFRFKGKVKKINDISKQHYHGCPYVMAFANKDEAQAALDWINSIKLLNKLN